MPARPPGARRARRPRPADARPGAPGAESGRAQGFTTRQVADVLGLPTSRILSWSRRGLITPVRAPDGAYVFSFQDVTVLRRVRELLDADVPARRVHEALEAIREALPVGRPLSAVDVSVTGRRVLVRDETSVWEASSGQLEMDFDAFPLHSGPATTTIATIAPTEPRPHAPPGADEPDVPADTLYDEAVDLESDQPDEAIALYRRAIALDADHADAHLNLGRLLHERGDLSEAEKAYRSALASDPACARAAYNLGVALEDAGRTDEARASYERALELDDDLASAHYNLSRLLERDGRTADALGHLVRYRHLLDRGLAAE